MSAGKVNEILLTGKSEETSSELPIFIGSGEAVQSRQ
jgi:hypothetical protein